MTWRRHRVSDMKEIIDYMKAVAPEEGCGFLLKNGKFIGVENVSDDPENSFEICPLEWTGVDVSAVIHSHPEGDQFLSSADRENQITTSVAWWIVLNDEIYKYRCAPLLRGRKFKYGVFDCYTLMRDAYHFAGIDLPNFSRSNINDDIDNRMFLDNFESVGFYRVDEIQSGDTILLDYGHGPCHAAIYIGNNRVIHHEIGRLSRRDELDDYMQNRIHSVWRHKEWEECRIKGILNDLEVSL